jgi:hypothetical protein
VTEELGKYCGARIGSKKGPAIIRQDSPCQQTVANDAGLVVYVDVHRTGDGRK